MPTDKIHHYTDINMLACILKKRYQFNKQGDLLVSIHNHSCISLQDMILPAVSAPACVRARTGRRGQAEMANA
jgi:hypothetical protein